MHVDVDDGVGFFEFGDLGVGWGCEVLSDGGGWWRLGC